MASLTSHIFGAGRFFGINNVANPTPFRSGTPQDMNIDFKRSNKSLFGDRQFAAAVGAGEMTVSGKITMGSLNARLFSDIMFADGSTTGTILQADGETGTVPAMSTYTVTVTNSSTWTTDLGVFNKTSGKVMTRVASSPATGQYSVAAGVYTFASGDASANVLISYLYTATGSGETISMANPLQGPTGNFTGVLAFLNGTAAQDVLTLNACVAADSSIAAKGSDFAKPTFGFDAYTDDNDVLGTFSFAAAA